MRISSFAPVNKRQLAFVVILLFHSAVFAQKTVSSVSLVDTSLIAPVDSIEEKLVALALISPAVKITESQSKINEYQLRATRNTWVNLFTINANYNNQVATQANQTGAILFPGFTMGFTIPLGTIVATGPRVKAAKQQLAISNFTKEQVARNIRAEIIGKYRQYLNYAQVISIQNQTVDDEETAYLEAKEQFRNGKINIDAYNTSQKIYNLELTRKLNLQLEQELVKLEIERMIGTSLDGIIGKKEVQK
jgi:outer membrane protein TolC